MAGSPAQPQAAEDSGGIFGMSDAARQGLMAAGLGMMASESPWFGTAVGQGGLAGLEAYQGAEKSEASAALAERKIAAQAEALKERARIAAETLKFRTQSATSMEALRQAQIAKLQRETDNPAGSKYGKAGTIVQTADGRYYSIQFAEDGTRSIQPLSVGDTALSPSKGVTEVDEGTGTRIINNPPFSSLRTISTNIAES